MKARTASRGQPLIVMALVLIAWVGMRAMTWQSPITYPASLSGFAQGSIVNPVTAQASDPAPMQANSLRANAQTTPKGAAAMDPAAKSAGRGSAQLVAPAPPPVAVTPAEPIGEPTLTPDYWEPAPLPPQPEYAPVPHWQGSALQPASEISDPRSIDQQPTNQRPVPTKIAAGHQILMAAAFSQMDLPTEVQAVFADAIDAKKRSETADLAAAQKVTPTSQNAQPSADRWSIDGWLLLRPDETASLAAIQPSYGRSQAGAVIRYNLATSSEFKPQAYARATGALERAQDGSSNAEFAAGLSARLAPNIPIRVAAEVRASEIGGKWEARPAAFAVTELPIAKLPFELRGEAYAQAGYVAGDFNTAFVDGQVRVDRKLADLGKSEVRIGAASWGGAQRGAARLDIGPTASVSFKLGGGNAKVSADYRLRVAGDAAPGSGPAVTLTAGF